MQGIIPRSLEGPLDFQYILVFPKTALYKLRVPELGTPQVIEYPYYLKICRLNGLLNHCEWKSNYNLRIFRFAKAVRVLRKQFDVISKFANYVSNRIVQWYCKIKICCSLVLGEVKRSHLLRGRQVE